MREFAWAIAIAIGLILAALVHGGIYEMTNVASSIPGSFGVSRVSGSVYAWRVNKFTGRVHMCISSGSGEIRQCQRVLR